MITRRDLLKTTLQGSALVAMAPTVPGFLARTARAMAPERDGRVLVVVELNGGNDGINTVVPFRDEGYRRHRPVLRLPADRLIKVDGQTALHPAMGEAARLWESGRLAIVQGVGYPNPSRSHFESLAVWHSARPGSREDAGLGWLGRGLDACPPPRGGAPAGMYLGAGALPAALRGRKAVASAMTRPEDFALDPSVRPEPAGRSESMESGGDTVGFVRRTTLDAYTSAALMAGVLRGKESSAGYPAGELAGRLRQVARLIKAGLGTRAYYAVQPGYDTHSGQLGAHAGLLSELSGALRAFLDDLAAASVADRVVVLAFSEFGRRVEENGSAGTDHGSAGPVLLAGPGVKAGLVGQAPSLTDLDDNGDLKVAVDFRRVYASVLEEWMGQPSREVLGDTFKPLSLFRV
jgi:uncharacterized protein (DUF1501 family)